MVSPIIMCMRDDFIHVVYHLQYIRFLRRTEGVEAAQKYFLDAIKSPTCTYHIYVAYAMMAFCLDKEPKVIFLLLVFELTCIFLITLFFICFSVFEVWNSLNIG
ncbi:hypothetical protein SAY86_005405 [Trapa natans]|uniref:Suppressor of forked domain-containing protein n=1 Tax=Trapa natans TaxID=22666 RepID=A0AAN7QSG3_TRANT|nr:hypothetical protein SAY86_005405 [Trapa natans]